MNTSEIASLAERFRERGFVNLATFTERLDSLPLNLRIPVEVIVTKKIVTTSHSLSCPIECLAHILNHSDRQYLVKLEESVGVLLVHVLSPEGRA